MKIYMCIDFKSFYASVECAKRNLNPFITPLVVADSQRGKGAITLAITPKLKNLGIKNRCRLYEIPNHINYLIACPKMSDYIKYSANIYEIYLNYFDKNDIHVYSIDEAFIDITNYIKLYDLTPKQLGIKLKKEIYRKTKIPSAVGIGTNLFLAKIALDIVSKKTPDGIAYLNEELFIKKLENHLPLTDFWQIGTGITKRLNKLNIYTLKDIKTTDESILYKEFGINAKILIDHAFGIEPTTILEIKEYKKKSQSLSSGQILFKNYNFDQAKTLLKEMVDNLTLELFNKSLKAGVIYLAIGYKNYKKTKNSVKLKTQTNRYNELIKEFLKIYDKYTLKDELIRQINISFFDLSANKEEQLNLFENINDLKKTDELTNVLLDLKDKYGKNIILRAVSYYEESNQMVRNNLIGGHNK